MIYDFVVFFMSVVFAWVLFYKMMSSWGPRLMANDLVFFLIACGFVFCAILALPWISELFSLNADAARAFFERER